MFRKLLFLLLIFINFSRVNGQCPVPLFSVQDTTCPLKDLNVLNNDNSTSKYQWDFCTGDLFLAPTAANITIPAGFGSFAEQLKVVQDNNNYYGFLANNGYNYIVRVNFGSSLNNAPTFDTLTHHPLINGLTGIDFVHENGKWLAFIIVNSPIKMVRAEFDSITDTDPVFTDLPITGLTSPLEIKIIDHYAFVTDLSGMLIRFSFPGNYLSNPVIVNPAINLGTLFGLDVVFDCQLSSYFAFVGSAGASAVGIYNFGSSLSNNPTLLPLISFSAAPRGVSLAYENNNWFMATTHSNDHFILSSFGSDLNSTPVIITDTDFGGGALATSFSCQLIKDSSQWHCFALNINNSGLLSHFKFPDNICTVSSSWSEDFIPSGINYGIATNGFYNYDVIVTDSNYIQQTFTDSVFITIIPPVAQFTTGPKCFGSEVQFYDSSSICYGNIVAWNWDFGDGNSSNIQNPTHTFAATGKYLISLTVYAANNDSSTVADSINIVPFPVADFSFVNNACAKSVVQFNDLSTAPGDSLVGWFWTFGDNGLSTDQHPNHSYNAGGIYDVTLIVCNTGGCADTIIYKDTILATPVPDFSFLHTCTNEGTLFINQTDSSGLTSINYTWDFGNSQTSTQPSPSNIYASQGTYLVTLSATATNNCIDSIQKNVIVSNKPQPDFTISTLVACTGNSIMVQDISNTGTDSTIFRKWDFGDNTMTDSLPVANHIYSSQGNYTITLTIATPFFCDSTIQKNITVVQSPAAGFTIDNECFGIPVDFTNTTIAVTGDPVTGNQWYFGDSTSATAIDTSHAYANPGTYPVTLTVTSQAGCKDSITLTATSYNVPIANFTNYPMLCTDTIATFIDLSTIISDSINIWQWDFGDGQSSVLQNPTNIYTQPGIKLVTLTATSNNGCFNTFSNIITVHKSPAPALTFTPTCFGATTCFTANDTNNPPNSNISWQWNFGDNTLSNVQHPCHKYSAPGTISVVLQATDTNSCRTFRTIDVIVNPVPAAGFYNSLACTGNTIMFTDSSQISSGSIVNWNWTINNSDTGSAQQAVHLTNASGLLPVLLTTTSDKGCTDTLLKYVQVNLSPVSTFSMSPLYSAPGELVTFNNSSSSSNSTYWFFGDGGIDNLYATTHVYQDTGYYQVILISSNSDGCSDTLIKNHVVLIPEADIAIISIASSEKNGLRSIEATLFNASNVDITDFEIVAQLQGTNAIHEFPLFYMPVASSAKKYTFQSNIQAGSQKPGYICVEVLRPNGLPDADPSNNKKCLSFESTFEILDINPNPVTDFCLLNINLSKKGTPVISIYDDMGRIVMDYEPQGMVNGFNSIPLDLSHLSKGMYSITITYNDDSRYIKVVKL